MNVKLIIKSLQVFFVRGLGAIAGFLLTLVVTNSVDTNEAGLFLFCIAIIQVFGALLTLGAPDALVRIVGANYEKNWLKINSDFSVIIRITFLLSLTLCIGLIVFNTSISLYFSKPELTELLPLAGVAVIIFSALQLFTAVLQGKEFPILASIVQNIVMPISFICLIYFISFWSSFHTAGHLLLLYLASLSFALILGVVIWFNDKRAHFLLNIKIKKELKSSLYPLTIVLLMSQLVQWSGQFASGKYLSSSDIAFFASAQRTALLVSFILIAVNLVVAPKFANAFAKNLKSEVNKLSLYSSKLMVLMGIPVLLFMFIFPEWLMGIFGEEYKVAAPLLQIMAVGQFINVITGSVGYLLIMTNHEKDFRNVVLFSGPLAIVLAFLLTKEYGLVGAAYATAISVATQNLLAVYMVKKRLGFNTLNIFRKI